MSVSRVLAAAVTAAMVLAASISPAAAQQSPDTEPEPAPEASEPTPAGSGPALGAGFVLEGEWVASGVVWLDWDDMDAAAGYEVMYRSAGGWVLLADDEAPGGVVVAFEGSGAKVVGLPAGVSEHWFAVRART